MTELLTAFIAFAVTALLGYVVIPWLRALHCGQSINEIGPSWHKYKEGTPAMGGLMFMAGFFLALAAGMALLARDGGDWKAAVPEFAGNAALCLVCSLLGFADDRTKFKHKENKGLTAKQKLAVQILAAVAYVVYMDKVCGIGTELDIPFLGRFDFGWFYWPLLVFSIVGIINAVNLTDGLDGLASSVTLVVSLGFALICSGMGDEFGLVWCCAMAGALVGFLCWNFKPAKVFMGDTGSMFLGGMVVSMAFRVRFQLLMLLAGCLYVIEAFSVIIQVIYFKATHGKRLFKMSPIHHHFEMCGWGEVKIVVVFCIVAAVGTGLSVWAALLR